MNLEYQQALFLKSFNFHSSYNIHPRAGKTAVSTGPCGTLQDMTLLIIQVAISILHVIELCYTTTIAVEAICFVSGRLYPVHNCSARKHVLQFSDARYEDTRCRPSCKVVKCDWRCTKEENFRNVLWLIFGCPQRYKQICVKNYSARKLLQENRVVLWNTSLNTTNLSFIKTHLIANQQYLWFCQEGIMTWPLVSANLTSFSVLIFCFIKNHTCVSPVQVTLEIYIYIYIYIYVCIT